MKLLLLGVLFASLTVGTQAQEVKGPLIIVQGSGYAEVAPDLADINLGIYTQASTAKKAQAQASAIIARVVQSLAKLGIERRSIKTDELTLEAVYREYPAEQVRPPVLVAYRVRNSLTVRVLNLRTVGAAVDAAVEAGSNEVSGIEFKVLRDLETRQDALRDAVAEARAKAEAIAQAMGVKLGSVVDVTESSGAYSGNDRVARLESRKPSTPVVPGMIGVRASVTVRYSIQ